MEAAFEDTGFEFVMTPEVGRQLEEAWRLCWLGQPRAALAMTLEILHLESSGDDIALRAQASSRIAWFCFQLGDIQLGIDHSIEARTLFALLGDKSGECWAGALHAWLLHEAGLMEQAAQYANEAVALAETLGDDWIASWAFNALAVVFWTCKQVDQALRWSERGVAISRRIGQPYLLGWWLINLGGIHSEAGYLHAARDDIEAKNISLRLALDINLEAITIAERVGDIWALQLGLCNGAEYHVALDEQPEAKAMLDRVGTLGEIGPRTTTQYQYTKGKWLSRQGASGKRC